MKPDGTRKVEKSYEYTVENRLKAVSDKNDLLAAMAYDGDGNRIFQLNYNLHTDDDWKGNSGNGNGNNKDNPGSGNNGNSSGNGTGSKKVVETAKTAEVAETANAVEETTETEPGFWENTVSFFTGDKEEKKETETATSSNAFARKNDKPNGNNGNGNGNKPDKPEKPNKPNDNTSTGGTNDNNGNANGNTNNTGGSQNQSGILFPIDGEVSELEGELIDMIKTTGKQKNYELVEYVNDVNREHTEVLMELNINGIMDTAYSYGDQRLTNERFTEWTGYYTYDPRGSVTGVTDDKGIIWQSYRYDAFGSITFGQPQYNNVYSYNAESYNPNVDAQYLRARYYSPTTADFISEDSYLGKLTDPLSLNRYNYTKSSPLNYVDPSGFDSYVFYLPEWKNEALDDQKRLMNYYGVSESEVMLIEVNNNFDLTNGWSGMGTNASGENVSIDTVVINTHADPNSLAGKDSSENWWFFESSDIDALDNKVLDSLILYGCNAGYLDYQDTNPASQFAKKVNGAPVLASDGTVYPNWNILGLIPMKYTSKNDAAFKQWRDQAEPDSTRDNAGWIVYQYGNGNSYVSTDQGKALTLEQMINMLSSFNKILQICVPNGIT